MQIRPAEARDIPLICGLYNKFFLYNSNQQPQYYKEAVETGKYPESVLESDTENLFVAADDNTVVGLIHVTEEHTPPYDCFVTHGYAVIVDLFVSEKFRGRGIGTRLLESAKQWAKARKLDYIELNVLAENENGIRFYTRERYKAVSQIMRYPL